MHVPGLPPQSQRLLPISTLIMKFICFADKAPPKVTVNGHSLMSSQLPG